MRHSNGGLKRVTGRQICPATQDDVSFWEKQRERWFSGSGAQNLDVRIPLGLLAAGTLTYFTWRARKSGEMLNRFSTLRRSEYPRIFQAGLIMRAGIVVFIITLTIAVMLGLLPMNSN
jgi:hypothetical protein